MRLYFTNGRAEAKLDPRDIPRDPHGHPLPDYEVSLDKDALRDARQNSFLDAFTTGDYIKAFVGAETYPRESLPLPEKIMPELKLVA